MDEETTYVSPRFLCKKFDVTTQTLARWAAQGFIRSISPKNTRGVHRYHYQDACRHFGLEPSAEATKVIQRKTILYARVSSSHQKKAGDLQRQIECLQAHCPKYDRVLQDVASGLNFKRKGLLALLDQVERGHVQKVVVSFRDRLARFGLELIERTFRKHGVTLDVVSRTSANVEDHDQQELSEDLLAVCNFFVAKNNGRRAAALARGRRERKSTLPTKRKRPEESEQDARESHCHDEDQAASQEHKRLRLSPTSVRDQSLDVQPERRSPQQPQGGEVESGESHD